MLGSWDGDFETLLDYPTQFGYMQSCSVTQLYLTLCHTMDCSPTGSSVHGIFQARILEWLPFPTPGIFLTQGLNLHPFHLLYWPVDSLPLSHLGNCQSRWAQYNHKVLIKWRQGVREERRCYPAGSEDWGRSQKPMHAGNLYVGKGQKTDSPRPEGTSPADTLTLSHWRQL